MVRVRVLVIDNPRSGQGDAGLYDYVRELTFAGADVTTRALSEDADLVALLADARSFDRVVSAGGDGTASGVAYALRASGVPIVAYPAGTANLLASNLGLPHDPRALAKVTLDGATMRTDLAEIECRSCDVGDGVRTGRLGFAVMAGAGFDADVMESAAALKPMLGAGAYFVSVLQNLAPTRAEIRLTLDGETVETDGIAVILVNFAKITFDIAVTHDSDATDGLLDVAVVRAHNLPALLPDVWAALLDRIGDYPHRPSLAVYSAREIRVETDPPLPLQSDGEVTDASTPFTARVLPGAATFVVPS